MALPVGIEPIENFKNATTVSLLESVISPISRSGTASLKRQWISSSDMFSSSMMSILRCMYHIDYIGIYGLNANDLSVRKGAGFLCP